MIVNRTAVSEPSGESHSEVCRSPKLNTAVASRRRTLTDKGVVAGRTR